MAEGISQAASWPNNIKNYVEELRKEMRMVTWPSWKQVRATTAVVIAATFAFAAYFFIIDGIIVRMINKLFEIFAPK
ncbi:MAG: preprotein translocase subunit SecE [Acidobacteriia bacterium]|nr:preprotein translocase subunit SecE [Terriglobia bacterium]